MPEQQSSLFGEPPEPSPSAAALALTAQPGKPLSRAQQAFNRLLAKIEKLRQRIEREMRRLDAALAVFARDIHPRLRLRSERRKELVRVLAPYLDDRRLKRRDVAGLRDLLANQLALLAEAEGGLEDGDLRALYGKLHGDDLDRMEVEGFAAAKGEMEAMFGEMGIDLDLSDWRPDMTDEEVAAKTADVAEKLRQREREERPAPARRPSKRQAAREERRRQAEELRAKSLASIYKQLAKALHPDLEPDPAARARKVALMQQLTVAYRANDLHTLLRLELEWLQGEQGDAARLTEEKLSIYNAVLREQTQELERELFMLPAHPRYQSLARPGGLFGFRVQLWTDDPAAPRALDAEIASMEKSLAGLRSPGALAEVREAVRHDRLARRGA